MRHSNFRHFLIRTHWKRWLIPIVCLIPYFFSIIWLIKIGLVWVAQIMLAPLCMGILLAALTFLLAVIEFRGTLR